MCTEIDNTCVTITHVEAPGNENYDLFYDVTLFIII